MGNKLIKSSLQHAGVKGMKWGIRQADEPTGTRSLEKYSSAEDFYSQRIGTAYKSFPTPYKLVLEDYFTPDNRFYWEDGKNSISIKGDKQMVDFFHELTSFIEDNRGVSSFEELNTIPEGMNSMAAQGDPEKVNDWDDPDLLKKIEDLYNNLDKYTEEEANKLFAEYGLYGMNCSNCSATYEMRRRGYDVEAMPYNERITQNSMSRDDVAKDYKGGLNWIETPVDDSSKTEARVKETILKSSSSDQRGYVAIDGHIFNYEVTKGKVNWVDAQASGVNHPDSSIAFKNTTAVKIARTDDKELNDSILTRVRNRDER